MINLCRFKKSQKKIFNGHTKNMHFKSAKLSECISKIVVIFISGLRCYSVYIAREHSRFADVLKAQKMHSQPF